MRTILFLCRLAIALVVSVGSDPVESVICCVPDQWEGKGYMDFMQVFIDSNTLYLYRNGSLNVAYDFTNSRAFYTLAGTQLSPLVPKPQDYNITTVIDYKKNIEYYVSNGDCEKSKVDQNMTRQCVNDDGILMSRGKVGRNVTTDTYIMSLSESFNNVRGTVQRGSCLPVHVDYILGSANPDSGSIINIDIHSITTKITDPSIFDEPPQCKGHTLLHRKIKYKSDLFTMVKEIFHRRMMFG